MTPGARGFQEGGFAVRPADRRFPRHALARAGGGASGDRRGFDREGGHDAEVPSRQDVRSGGWSDGEVDCRIVIPRLDTCIREYEVP